MKLEHNQAELIHYLGRSQHGAPEVLVQLALTEVITKV